MMTSTSLLDLLQNAMHIARQFRFGDADRAHAFNDAVLFRNWFENYQSSSRGRLQFVQAGQLCLRRVSACAGEIEPFFNASARQPDHQRNRIGRFERFDL